MSKSNWITTFSGKKIYPLNPSSDEICIEDIAHALSNICRFTGHTKSFYSVAQHSVLVSVHGSIEHRLSGLMHDACEAYICDIAKPLKMTQELSGYQTIERRLMKCISEKFGFDFPLPEEVKYTDYRMLITEAQQLLNSMDGWIVDVEPIKTIIHPTSPENAERAFLDWFEILRR